MRQPIPVPFGSVKSLSSLASDQRLVNCFAEEVDGAIVIHGAPGLPFWAQVATEASRGIFANGPNELLAVHGDKLYRYNDTGAGFVVGEIKGSGPVRFARNGAAVAQTVILTNTQMYLLAGGVLSTYAPVALTTVPVDIDWVDGYFIFAMADGAFFISGINNTAINALDFAVAESSPDGLVGVKVVRREVYLIGTETTEVWTNIGDPLFAFSRIPGGTIQSGCSSRNTIVELNGVLLWLDDAANVVLMAGGYNPQNITPRGLSEKIAAVADKSTIFAFRYELKQRQIYVISHLTFTWLFDVASGSWTEAKSENLLFWRINSGTFQFGKNIMGSSIDGGLYWIDELFHAEGNPEVDGSEIVMSVRMPRLKTFPMGGIVNQIDIDFETGVGNDISTTRPDTIDPQIMLRWSKDGGKTFPNGRQISIGKKGEYRKRVRTTRLGSFGDKGIIFEISCSSRVAKTLLGVSAMIEPLDI